MEQNRARITRGGGTARKEEQEEEEEEEEEEEGGRGGGGGKGEAGPRCQRRRRQRGAKGDSCTQHREQCCESTRWARAQDRSPPKPLCCESTRGRGGGGHSHQSASSQTVSATVVLLLFGWREPVEKGTKPRSLSSVPTILTKAKYGVDEDWRDLRCRLPSRIIVHSARDPR